MLAATASVNNVAIGQPSVISRGPPISRPCPNSVTAPVRMEMMEKETAKLENPPIPRINSCAYPKRNRSAASRESEVDIFAELLTDDAFHQLRERLAALSVDKCTLHDVPVEF